MKKTSFILAAISLLTAAVVLTACNPGSKGNVAPEEDWTGSYSETVEMGSVYVISDTVVRGTDGQDYRADAKVRDSQNEEVDVLSGQFHVEDLNGYTIGYTLSISGKQYERTLNVIVQDTIGPEVSVGAISDGVLSVTWTDPEVIVSDVKGNIASIVKKVICLDDGTTFEIKDDTPFIPEKTGAYRFVVTVTDVSGNETEETADFSVVRGLGEGEINDFEIPAFRNVFTEKNGTQLSVVKAADVGLTAPSGEYILQTSIAPADTYPTVVMPASYLEQTDLKEIAESSVQNKVFSFSVYNALSRNIVIELWLNGQKAPSYSIAPQSWQEVSLRLDDYLAALKTSLLIEVTWGINATDENTLVYFDHFEVKDYLPPQLAEGEIDDFELDDQRNSFSTQGTLSAEIVTAADIGLTAPSGTKILKAWTNVGTDYYAVILKEDYLSGTPIKTATGQEKYLTFEIRCDEVRYFELWIGNNKLGFETEANSWKTVRLPMTTYTEFGAIYLTTDVTGGVEYYVDNFRLEDFA